MSKDYNIIYVIINRLIKERYYISYIAEEDGTTVEIIADILIREVFRLYGLLVLIISNRGL